MCMTESKMYSPVVKKAQSSVQDRVGLDVWSEKIPFHHFYQLIPKPEICTEFSPIKPRQDTKREVLV